MTPVQFLSRMKRNEMAAAYLFLGAEAYERRRCRQALLDAVLAEDRENGLAQYDLNETSLAEVVDDARSLSLDASVLGRDYCTLMHEVWQAAPAMWRLGRSVPEPPPSRHPCANK